MHGGDYDVISWDDIQRMEDGVPFENPAFTPWVDFDPSDPNDVEIMSHVMEAQAHSKIARLEKEIAELHARLYTNEAVDDGDMYDDRE